MADKIVQLTDKNSNNLYPIAGAVHENAVSTGGLSNSAVTTPKIANTSVTSQKIDWTTIDTGWVDITLLNGWTSHPDMPLKCRRFGKVVAIRGSVVPPSGLTPGDIKQVAQVSEDFKPSVIAMAMGVGQYTSYFRVEVRADGIIDLQKKIRGEYGAGTASVTENNRWDLAWYGVNITYLVD